MIIGTPPSLTDFSAASTHDYRGIISDDDQHGTSASQ
jgi:hypothetical protein